MPTRNPIDLALEDLLFGRSFFCRTFVIASAASGEQEKANY